MTPEIRLKHEMVNLGSDAMIDVTGTSISAIYTDEYDAQTASRIEGSDGV